MKKAYIVCSIGGEGGAFPLLVTHVGTRTSRDGFNDEREAQDFARQLAQQNPGTRFDVLITTSSYRAGLPVVETTKFD